MTSGPAPATFEAALERTLRFSRYVQRSLGAHPSLADELRASAGAPFAPEAMRAALEGPGESLGARLRHLRRRVMVRLAHRDLDGAAGLDEVFATMTALAPIVEEPEPAPAA